MTDLKVRGFYSAKAKDIEDESNDVHGSDWSKLLGCLHINRRNFDLWRDACSSVKQDDSHDELYEEEEQWEIGRRVQDGLVTGRNSE